MTDAPLSPHSDAIAESLRKAKERTQKAAEVKQVKRQEDSSYPERLRASLARDSALFKNVRAERIEASKAEWRKLLNSRTFQDATSDYPAAKARLNRLLRQEGLHATSMAFIGEVLGSGKTWQGFGFLNDAIALGALVPSQVIFGSETDIISRVASGGFDKFKNLDALLNWNIKSYFIDDVGTAYSYRAEQRHEIWFNLIDHIYAKELTLVITSNLPFTRQGLGQWIGERSFDRLQAMVGADGVVLMRGANKRPDVLAAKEAQLLGN